MRLAKLFYRRSPALAACGLVALSACASNKALDNQLATSREAVDQAQIAGAQQTAPADYDTAIKKLNRANTAKNEGDQDAAMRLAQQAQADANVARAHTDSIQSSSAAAELARSNLVLRETIARANRASRNQ